MAMGEAFTPFQPDYNITGRKPKGFKADRGTRLPLPTHNLKQLAKPLSADALFSLGTGEPNGSVKRATGGDSNLKVYQETVAKYGFETDAFQKALTAVKDGWSSGGMSGALGSIFGGGATDLVLPIIGGLSGLASGYMGKRTQDRADKVAQQNADANTLNAGKSPGGFRWDDPDNTPDKYLDGTVTKGNFFNPGGLLGKRTV